MAEYTDRRLSLLGSTGSIGTQALDVARCLGIRVEAMAARRNVSLLEQQIREFSPSVAAVMEEDAAANHARWRFAALPERLPVDMPLHFIGGKQDEATPPAEHILPLYTALRDRGSPTSYTEIDDGHGFTSHRIGLTELIYEKLCAMDKS